MPLIAHVLFIIFGVWTLGLSIWCYRLYRHYNRLTQGVTRVGLTHTLESLLNTVEEAKKLTNALEREAIEIRHEAKAHIQRVGIVRFNPFSDTGGSQSFTIALLDDRQSGIVMTSLYARSGNRWYVKEIREGAGVSMELSKEELAAIAQSRKKQYEQ